MSTNVKQLKDEEGNLFPYTHEKAVLDDTGTTLSSKLAKIVSDVDEGITQTSAAASEATELASHAVEQASNVEAIFEELKRQVDDGTSDIAKIQANSAAIAETNGKLSELERNTGTYKETEIVVGHTEIDGYWKSESEYASSSQIVTFEYPINASNDYYLTGRWPSTLTNCLSFAFVDNVGNLVGFGFAHSYGTLDERTDEKLNVPSNATKLQVSVRNLESIKGYFSLKEISAEYTPIRSAELKESIETIEDKLPTIEDNAKYAKEKVDELTKDTGTFVLEEKKSSADYCRLSNGGITDTTDTRMVTSYVVNAGDVFNIEVDKHSSNKYSHIIAFGTSKTANIGNGISTASAGFVAPVTETTKYDGVVVPEGYTAMYVSSDMGFPPRAYKKVVKKSIEGRVDDIEKKISDISSNKVDVVLPDNIDVVCGETLMLYYRNVVRVPNIDNYYVEAYCDKGEYQQHCCVVKTKTDMAGQTYPLTIKVFDKEQNILGEATTNVRVIQKLANPVTKKNILVVGSSSLTSGTITNELIRRFTLTSGSGDRANPKGLGLTNVEFVGRLTGLAYTSAHQEAIGGASFYKRYGKLISPQVRFNVVGVDNCGIGAIYKDSANHTYTVNEINFVSGGDGNILCDESTTPSATSGTLTRVSGSGDDTITYSSYIMESGNPFWNTSTNSLDFQKYATDYCNGKIDVMVVMMAGNDRGPSGNNIGKLFTEMIKPFARKLHTDFPACKLVMCINSQPSLYGGGNTRYESHYWYCDYAHELYAMMKDAEFSGWVTAAHTMQTFDAANMFPVKQVAVANRVNKTEDMCSNFVHPTGAGGQFKIGDDEGGCLCYADAIYNEITKVLS